MDDKITERIYCSDKSDNSAMWAALMGNHNNGYESALLANQWQNNPFAYNQLKDADRPNWIRSYFDV